MVFVLICLFSLVTWLYRALLQLLHARGRMFQSTNRFCWCWVRAWLHVWYHCFIFKLYVLNDRWPSVQILRWKVMRVTAADCIWWKPKYHRCHWHASWGDCVSLLHTACTRLFHLFIWYFRAFLHEEWSGLQLDSPYLLVASAVPESYPSVTCWNNCAAERLFQQKLWQLKLFPRNRRLKRQRAVWKQLVLLAFSPRSACTCSRREYSQYWRKRCHLLDLLHK